MRETARIFGATEGNRTLILALARPRTNHCTTAAYGADYRNRTHNLLITSQLLYQLR